jgi:hypothetical protein
MILELGKEEPGGMVSIIDGQSRLMQGRRCGDSLGHRFSGTRKLTACSEDTTRRRGRTDWRKLVQLLQTTSDVCCNQVAWEKRRRCCDLKGRCSDSPMFDW